MGFWRDFFDKAKYQGTELWSLILLGSSLLLVISPFWAASVDGHFTESLLIWVVIGAVMFFIGIGLIGSCYSYYKEAPAREAAAKKEQEEQQRQNATKRQNAYNHSQLYSSLIQKYNVNKKRQISCNYIKYYAWVNKGNFYMFPIQYLDNSTATESQILTMYPLKTIEISDIEHFRLEGDIYIEKLRYPAVVAAAVQMLAEP